MEDTTDSLIQTLRGSLRQHADRELLVDLAAPGGAERVSGAGLWAGACRAARALAERGATPGERVALSGANSARWVAAALGVRLAGCTLVPLDSELSQAEREGVLRFVEPRLVLADRRLSERFADLAPQRLELENLDLTPGAPDCDPLPLGADQPWMIIFTSGTTGIPKGVTLSEANLAHQVRLLTGQPPGLIDHTDRALNLLPMHHVYPFSAATLTPLAVGCPIVYPRSLRGEDIAAACADERISILVVVPQVLGALNRRILDQAAARPWPSRLAFRALYALGGLGVKRGLRPGKYLFRPVHARFPALRYAACGGARLEESTHRSLARLGFRIVEAYGLSETAPVVCLNSLEQPVFGSVGRPAPEVELRLEPSPAAAGPGEGEVLVRGPNVTAGYYRNPAATREAFDSAGWLRTGDLGRLDPRGNLVLTGRSKEVLVLPSGKNIYPEELEKVYARAPLVEELCLCLTGARGEERLTALVLPAREELVRRSSTKILDDVRFALENIARELPPPQRVTRVLLSGEPLPRTRLGKLRRWEIAAQLERGSQAETQSHQDNPDGDELLEFARDWLKLDHLPADSDSLEIGLGLDSLSRLEFFSAFERRFGLRLSEAAAASAVCLGDLRAPLDAAGTAAAAEVTLAPDRTLDEATDPGRSLGGKALRAFGWLALRVFSRLLFRAELRGLEHLPPAPYILAPNHVSYLDWVVLYGMLPRRVSARLYSVGIADILDHFPLSALCYPGRVIKTGTLATTALSLEHALQVLKRGLPLCLFPEGKRSFDGTTDLPKRGLDLLAARSGAPVVPVYIHGSWRTMSRQHPALRPVRISLELLPPLQTTDKTDSGIGRRWHQLMQERAPL